MGYSKLIARYLLYCETSEKVFKELVINIILI